MINLVLILFYLLIPAGARQISGYNFKMPEIKFLPPVLHEISGMATVSTTEFVCVQDEKGILFIYDAIKNRIDRQYIFNIDGDYEGIAGVGNTIYILRSDGTLFEIADYNSRNPKVNSYITGIPANNNEGLCYDADKYRLLIACKGKIGKGKEFKDRRVIYSFDLKKKILSKDPVFDFDLVTIKKFAMANEIQLPVKVKKKGMIKDPVLRFRTSAIAIHPVTKKLFLLSAADHMLFVFKMNGEIEHMEQLNAFTYNKAEGITFFPDGDMLISNEGQDKRPTVLRLNYKK